MTKVTDINKDPIPVKGYNEIVKITQTPWSQVYDDGNAPIDNATDDTIANLKAKVFRQDTEPGSGMVAGDIWIDTNDGDRPYSYNGANWIETLTVIDGGKITTGTIDAGVVTVSNINAGNITTGTLDAGVVTISNLTVGTNVGIGTAEDSAGVTTIVGDTVTTAYVNALNVNAATVSASISITTPTIVGGTITIGTGDNVFIAGASGIQLGDATFADAPFSVNMSGDLIANSATITGGTIDGTTTIGGRAASILATAIDDSGHFADDAINTASGTILGEFGFTGSGALQIGTYESGVTGDIKISPTGILGRDKDDNTTFSINATTGVAVLNGLVVGTNVGIGTAEDSAGVTTIVGNVVTTDYVNALSVVAGSIDAVNINVGTLTGFTIQTAASGERLRMQGSPANEFQFLDDNTEVGHLKIDDDGSGGYYAEIYIEELGPAIQVGSIVGAAASVYFSAPYFSSAGRAAVGQVTMEGNNVLVGLSWAGGADATWDFDLGTNLAKISSDIVPSSTADLGSTGDPWNKLWVDEINLNGTARTTWPASYTDADARGAINDVIGSDGHLDSTLDCDGNDLIDTGDIIPDDNKTQDLGSATKNFEDLYLEGDIFSAGDGSSSTQIVAFDNDTTAIQILNRDLIPYADDEVTCGRYDQRWSDTRTVKFNGADYGFENDWYLTEHDRVGIEEVGIALVDSKNELKLFIGESGIYVKGGNVKNLDNLPYVKTTIEQRVRMDNHPEIRKRVKDKTILELPDPKNAKVGGVKYKEKKILLKANKE